MEGKNFENPKNIKKDVETVKGEIRGHLKWVESKLEELTGKRKTWPEHDIEELENSIKDIEEAKKGWLEQLKKMEGEKEE